MTRSLNIDHTVLTWNSIVLKFSLKYEKAVGCTVDTCKSKSLIPTTGRAESSPIEGFEAHCMKFIVCIFRLREI